MKINLRHCFYFLIALISFSCTGNTIYYSYHPTPSKGWEKSDTLHFDIPVNDSLMLLHISTEVRYSDQYPYKDFWVEIRKNFKGESVFEVDTLQFILADSIGRRSEQGWSCLYQIKHRMNPVFVRDTGMYAIKINHLMKDGSLIGIHDIGIKIDK